MRLTGLGESLDRPEDAGRHVAGYAVSNDVSERESQLERGGQWDYLRPGDVMVLEIDGMGRSRQEVGRA